MWLVYTFRNLVHYHVEEHGGIQGDAGEGVKSSTSLFASSKEGTMFDTEHSLSIGDIKICPHSDIFPLTRPHLLIVSLPGHIRTTTLSHIISERQSKLSLVPLPCPPAPLLPPPPSGRSHQGASQPCIFSQMPHWKLLGSGSSRVRSKLKRRMSVDPGKRTVARTEREDPGSPFGHQRQGT